MSKKNVLQILSFPKFLFFPSRWDAYWPQSRLGFLRFLHWTILFSLPAQAAVTNTNDPTTNSAGHGGHICDLLVPRLPNVKTRLCMNAELQPTQGKSVQGRVLFSRDIMAASPQLRILVIGGIHGDEKSSGSLVLHWIQHAHETPSNALWRFIPVLNPDGLVAKPARRMNANGVDLNRNFPTSQWAKEAKFYWETRTRRDPRRWPGPNPLSEPESRFLHSEMDSFKPDLIVSIHAPYGLLDYDGPSAPPPKLGRLFLDQVGIFPGSLGNYAGVNRGVPVVTIELPNALLTPTDAEMRQMWLDLLRWVNERVKPSATTTPSLRTE